jgi:hypothetical protein
MASETPIIFEAQKERPAPELSEFDLGYYGWRVALAACFGVMAGFGSLFVYTFAVYVKPLSGEFGWSREEISRGFRVRGDHAGPSVSTDRPVARPLRPSPHHSAVHAGVQLRNGLAGTVAPSPMAVLSHLYCAWRGRCSARLGMALAIVMVGA